MLSSRREKPFEGKHEIFISRREFKQLFEDCEGGRYLKTDDLSTLLLCAKAYFLQKKYQKTVEILNKVRKDYSTKILYERQALLFKSSYFIDRSNHTILQNIIDEYFHFRNRCPGRKLTNFHDTMIRNLQRILTVDKPKQNLPIDEIKAKCREMGKKTKFQGMKSYLVEKNWNEKWVDYIAKDKEHPGPISNFTLINHIFQFQPPREKRRSYMENILFPATEEIHYVVLRKEHWEFIHELYGGYPVERIFMYNPKVASIEGGDNLAKIMLSFEEEQYVMHEQIGTFWEISVLPRFLKLFGPGQLKEETQNKGEYMIVQEGTVYQPDTPLKYVIVEENLIKAQSAEEKRKRAKLITRYDMEAYEPKKAEVGQIGLANLGNTCYMNASLQCLSNIRRLRDYFLGHQYLKHINLSQNNKVGSFGSVTCAFAEIVKRLWASSDKTRYIDPRSFKKAFQTRFQQFRGQEQEDAHEFMSFLLNCLHDDLNAANIMFFSIRQSKSQLIYENAKNQAIVSHEKRNKSIINTMFMGHMFEELSCQNCTRKRFKFEVFMMLQLQVPLDSPTLKFYLIVGQKYNEEALTLSIFLNGIDTVEEALQLIEKKRQNQGMKYYMCFVERSTYEIYKVFEPDTKIKKVVSKKKEEYHLFVYELPANLKPDETLYCFEYKYEKHPRGFPRIVPLKKDLWGELVEKEQKKEKLQELKKKASQTLCLPITEDKLERIEEVQCQLQKDSIYSYVVKVEMKQNAQKFFNCTQQKQPFGNQPNEHDRTLQSCLQHLQEPQMIMQQEGWQCEGCNQETTALRKCSIESAGEIFAIVLKRFTEDGKITTKITYPLDNFNIAKFIHDPKQRQSYVYKLVGVVMHRGQLNYGHYTSVCRHPIDDKWYNYDDDYVRCIPEETVVSDAAYILFYQKK